MEPYKPKTALILLLLHTASRGKWKNRHADVDVDMNSDIYIYTTVIFHCFYRRIHFQNSTYPFTSAGAKDILSGLECYRL